jgi:DNA-directed RNA polymerase specialized sigma24 family protein
MRRKRRLRMTTTEALALARLRQWSAERQALKNGKIHNYLRMPGRPSDNASTNRFDAALVRCIDFEREFGKLPTDSQTLLLLAYREKQPQLTIAQITGWSPRAISYKLPAALADLSRVLDKADLL